MFVLGTKKRGKDMPGTNILTHLLSSSITKSFIALKLGQML